MTSSGQHMCWNIQNINLAAWSAFSSWKLKLDTIQPGITLQHKLVEISVWQILTENQKDQVSPNFASLELELSKIHYWIMFKYMNKEG